MLNNNQYDPNNISRSDPATPPNLSEPASAPASPAALGSIGGSAHRRLPPNTALSSGRYRIEKLIAAGGMGAVYQATDTRFNRPCAVKEMLDEFQTDEERNQAVEWFSREATLLLDLNHPCIPRVRDFFVEGGRHYLVMDLIVGRTLGEVLEKEGNVMGANSARGISEVRARSWMQQVGSVLGYLHRQNPPIIFRDLKPSNIMVTDNDEIKLIDFGIARTFQTQRQATIIMTLGYAPPEQLHGMPEPRSDIYALGATIHRVLTRHDAANNKPSIFNFPPLRSLRPDISPAFDQIIMKALAPNLEQRWPSAQEMEKAILNLSPVNIAPPVGPIPQGAVSTPLTPGSASSNPISGPGSGPRPGTSIQIGVTGPAGPHILAAQSHMAAGRIDAAYPAINTANAAEPNNGLVHKLFGQYYARKLPPQPDVALQAYNRSLQLNPDDAETHKLIGDIWHILRHQPMTAIPAYQRSLSLNSQDFETHQRLGQCYEKTNQLEPALREFQAAVGLAPKQPGLHFSVGSLAFRLGRLPIAEQEFVQVLVLDPAQHQTRFLLSQVYERENKLENAFEQCNHVLRSPMGADPAVQQMHQRLRARLGR